MSSQPLKVLYVLGLNRSGTTLIGSLLGQVPGFFAVGEVNTLWAQIMRGRECTCGKDFAECDVWSRVFQEILGDLSTEQLEAMDSIARYYKGQQIQALLRFNTWRDDPQVDAFLDITSKMYKRIAEISGSHVIVDTSKRITYAHILKHIPGLKVYLLHVVRDPRATAFSSTQHRFEEKPLTAIQKFITIGKTSLSWNISNGFSQAIWNNSQSYKRIQYKDFVSDPHTKIGEILKFLGEDVNLVNQMPYSEEGFELKTLHLTGGNARFKMGKKIILQESIDWRKNMPRSLQIMSMLLSMPQSLRYGYRW